MQPIDINTPVPGFYKRKLTKGGAYVPCRIWLVDGDRDPETGELMSDQHLFCEVDGQAVDPWEEWQWLAKNPIGKAEFDWMVADAEHARRYRPGDPKATPRQPIDINRTPSLF